MPEPLGTETNSPSIDRGPSALTEMKPPKPTGNVMGIVLSNGEANATKADQTAENTDSSELL